MSGKFIEAAEEYFSAANFNEAQQGYFLLGSVVQMHDRRRDNKLTRQINFKAGMTKRDAISIVNRIAEDIMPHHKNAVRAVLDRAVVKLNRGEIDKDEAAFLFTSGYSFAVGFFFRKNSPE
jgi:hypothetical protein